MNKTIREAMQKAGVRQWQVAAELGISEATIVRWLRQELTEERSNAIFSAIEALSGKEV